MKQVLPAARRVASSSAKKISTSILPKLNRILLAAFVLSTLGVLSSYAQFSKPVIVLKGTISSQHSGKPYAVKISIRSGENKALEVTSSQSNSISGRYLVVLQPKKKYWICLETAESIISEEQIETPPVMSRTIEICKDFVVTAPPTKDISAGSPNWEKPGAGKSK